MKSKRLSDQDRHIITRGFLVERFGEDSSYKVRKNVEENIVKVWGKKLIGMLYTPAEKRRIKSLPDGWLPEVSYITFTARVLGERSHSVTIDCEPEMRVATSDSGRYIDVAKDERFAEIREDFHEACKAMATAEEDFHNLWHQVEQCLSQYNTTKQLADNWPEALAMLPAAPPPVKAVMIAPAKINELCGVSQGGA